MDRPDKTEWYLMQVSQRVDQLILRVAYLLSSKRPPDVELDSQRLKFTTGVAAGLDDRGGEARWERKPKRERARRDPKTGRLVFTRNKADMTPEELDRAMMAARESKAIMGMKFGFDPDKSSTGDRK